MPQWMKIPRRASVNQVMSGLSLRTGAAVSSADERTMPEPNMKATHAPKANCIPTAEKTEFLYFGLINCTALSSLQVTVRRHGNLATHSRTRSKTYTQDLVFNWARK